MAKKLSEIAKSKPAAKPNEEPNEEKRRKRPYTIEPGSGDEDYPECIVFPYDRRVKGDNEYLAFYAWLVGHGKAGEKTDFAGAHKLYDAFKGGSSR